MTTDDHATTEAARLAALNDRFVALNEAAKAELLARLKRRGLILLVQDRLTFYHGDGPPRVFTGLRPPRYSQLKTLAHLPGAVIHLLSPSSADGALSPATLGSLAAYREAIESAATALQTGQLPDAEGRLRPVRVLGIVTDFLDRAIARRQVKAAQLTAFARAASEDLPLLFTGAAAAQLQVCRDVMDQIRDALPPEAWADLRVAVTGPQTARRDQSLLHFFAEILQVPMHGDPRLVYVEVEEEEAALQTLAAVNLDALTADTLFGDPGRLARDVMGEGARLTLGRPAPAVDLRARPIPIRPGAPTSRDYGALAIDLEDPRAGEPLVDVAAYGIAGIGFYGRTDGHNAPYHRAFDGALPGVWVRRSVAERLVRVNRRLAAYGVELFLLNGYRRIALQQAIWDFFMAQARAQLDDPSEADCATFASTYCSDPRAFDPADSRTWPVHATGGAVDTTLRLRADGQQLLMGGLFDDPAEVSHSDYLEAKLGALGGDAWRLTLSEREALANRRLLCWAMAEEDFANYAYEWWHFDWGTQLWALAAPPDGPPRRAFYGLAQDPEETP
ncbi:MAG: M15 family metallopeptidase [Pseudomonadota bacterium]